MPPVETAPNNPAEPAPEVKQPTLKEILADKNMSRDFNAWMEGRSQRIDVDGKAVGDVMANMLDGKADGVDLEILAERRREFLERMSQEKAMKETLLSQSSLRVFVEGSTELKEIKELIGEEGIKEALSAVFHEKAVAGEGDKTHELMFADYTGWVASAGKLAANTQELNVFLEQAHLTQEQAVEVSNIGDVQGRANKIAEIFNSNGIVPEGSKRRHWFSKKEKAWSKEQLGLIRMTAIEMSKTMVVDGSSLRKTKWMDLSRNLADAGMEAEKAQRQIIDSMGAVLSGEGAEEIGRILTSEAKPKDKNLSFSELRSEVASMKNPDNIRAQFLAYADDEFGDFVDAGQYDLNDLTSQENAVNKFYESFGNKMKNKIEGKGGFWGAIYEVIVLPFMDDLLPELKKQTTVDKQNKKLSIKKGKKTT